MLAWLSVIGVTSYPLLYNIGVYGSVPQVVVDQEDDIVQRLHASSSELDSLKQVADNAQKQYIKSRGQPSPESVKRAKQLPQNVPMHPIFQQLCSKLELEATHLLDGLKTYKPSQVMGHKEALIVCGLCLMCVHLDNF